ncbi:hypothetical protein [Yersinia pseudotuberculosis]|uniref:hypothetical protein n=1 Tax=Yersinia pseudotuberculosis TaxID=633 RepID=UPI0005E4E2E5|nr:hypothetical protein [Yersinia pseudotuberculosis]CFV38232.1 Uncharacterised protein [Yersinia pseudotuberculosis]
MIIFNKEFEAKYLKEWPSTGPIPINMLSLINNGFVMHSNECIFFLEKQPIDSKENDGNFFDKTEQEIFYNSLRVSDYVEKDIVSVAINVTKMIISALREKFPEKRFEVITSFDDFEGEIDAMIKLHTLRDGEVPYINVKDINKYQQPIFICRTS